MVVANLTLDSITFFIIDAVIVLLLIRTDYLLAKIVRNTRRDDHHKN